MHGSPRGALAAATEQGTGAERADKLARPTSDGVQLAGLASRGTADREPHRESAKGRNCRGGRERPRAMLRGHRPSRVHPPIPAAGRRPEKLLARQWGVTSGAVSVDVFPGNRDGGSFWP